MGRVDLSQRARRRADSLNHQKELKQEGGVKPPLRLVGAAKDEAVDGHGFRVESVEFDL
jgi:hypothetical protein